MKFIKNIILFDRNHNHAFKYHFVLLDSSGLTFETLAKDKFSYLIKWSVRKSDCVYRHTSVSVQTDFL
jgi:hypothetical protein